MKSAPQIDLRSDTMTAPSPAMREAMAKAEVGDDVWGEDPTVKELEARVAELYGMEQGLFVPSGTMANQLALLCHTRRGDEVFGPRGAHVNTYEGGAAAAVAGIQFTELGSAAGAFDGDQLLEAIRPADVHVPPPGLVWLENTHNRGGGRIFPTADIARLARVTKSLRLPLHVDGARLLNAAVATGQPAKEILRTADSASLCLSKGLGAPVGSVLAGPRDFIAQAHRWRKRLGGGMRQSGILAAAGIFALEHHVQDLEQDHKNAQELAQAIAAMDGVSVDLEDVQTNIVVFSVTSAAPAAALVVERCSEAGLGLAAISPSKIRAVTHRDVSVGQIAEAKEILQAALSATLS